jgi:hypothetical protein
MKTTTYLCIDGKTTVHVSDKPLLTREQYAEACRVIREAAKVHVAYLKSKRG